MIDDHELLQQYALKQFEPAFSELVTRHIDLVYSAALRLTAGDSHLAEDVTQTVFIDLARKAATLSGDIRLAGWLYRHSCYTAAKAVRSEKRRKTRETTAMDIGMLDQSNEVPWEGIAPYLDESLNELSASDRDSIVLRFLEANDFRTVGAAFGISEGAAQMRVTRALEKLRSNLVQRGFAIPTRVLAGVLASKVITAAPIELVARITGSALAAVSGTGTTAFLKFLTTAKLKTALVSAILVVSVATSLFFHFRGNKTSNPVKTPQPLKNQMAQLKGLNASALPQLKKPLLSTGRLLNAPAPETEASQISPTTKRETTDPLPLGAAESPTSKDPQIGTNLQYEPAVPIEWVSIPAGRFNFGSPESENGRRSNERLRSFVTLTHPFSISKYEITLSQFAELMGRKGAWVAAYRPEERAREYPNLPITMVSWKQAVEFCEVLTARDTAAGSIPAGLLYRLPTEVEWEYACRAGSSTTYCFGDREDILERYAWYGDPNSKLPSRIGLKRPNPWGIYDMHGNAGEWCLDVLKRDLPSLIDPVGQIHGVGNLESSGQFLEFHTTRGGGRSSDAQGCRSSFRHTMVDSQNIIMAGFRIVLASPVE